jgi:hypothetical protein
VVKGIKDRKTGRLWMLRNLCGRASSGTHPRPGCPCRWLRVPVSCRQVGIWKREVAKEGWSGSENLGKGTHQRKKRSRRLEVYW